MSILLRTRGSNSQPQVTPRIRKAHKLAGNITFAMVGSNPFVNAATGSPVLIARGGTGFSQRATSHGTSLYTPNGGWADIAVEQDWVGPNTIITLSRVNGVDSPWGGVFSKNTAAADSQFNVGRSNTTDTLYGGVDNALANPFSGSSIVALTGFNVAAYTHSGAASTGMSYYLNGSLVGTTSALGTQLTGTGPLGLGRARNLDAAFDSDVDWSLTVRINKVLSAEEVKALGTVSSLWSLFEAPATSIYFPDSIVPPPASGYGFAKVSGSWKTLSGTYVKVSGVWKQGTFSPKVSGSWKTLV